MKDTSMTEIEELENKLGALRTKWKSFPKGIHDQRWPAFRVDKSLALYYKMKIEKIREGNYAG